MRNALLCGLLAAAVVAGPARPAAAEDKAAHDVYPIAIFPFEERGAAVKDYAAKVSDVLFAALAADPKLYLVDRSQIDKTLSEQGLNLSGMVRPDDATKVGQLTGAKILVTGSVVQVDKSIYLVAKIIGTETSRVAGASVKGRITDDLAPLAEELAAGIAKTIGSQAPALVARKVTPSDRAAELNRKLGGGKRPTVLVTIAERHVGHPTIDPAAQTEMALLCQQTGFAVVDAEEGTKGKADVLITGEGFSEFAGRVGALVSVKARVEIKAVDRQSGEVLAVDRQTAVVVDLTEQLAGKAALEEASAVLAGRLLPRLVKP